MGTEKKYSVIELAELLGVPRTTINDWLSKYSMYIDFTVQGKRRVYTDSSLAVLKEISGLRNSGMSSVDIEAELAKRHPVRAEPELQEPPQTTSVPSSGEGKNTGGATAGADTPPPGRELHRVRIGGAASQKGGQFFPPSRRGRQGENDHHCQQQRHCVEELWMNKVHGSASSCRPNTENYSPVIDETI